MPGIRTGPRPRIFQLRSGSIITGPGANFSEIQGTIWSQVSLALKQAAHLSNPSALLVHSDEKKKPSGCAPRGPLKISKSEVSLAEDQMNRSEANFLAIYREQSDLL